MTAADIAEAPETGGEAEARRVVSRIVSRIALLAIGLMLVGAATLSFVAVEVFDDHLDASLTAKATTIGWILSEDFGRAAALGLPLDRLPDVPAFLQEFRASQPEILYLGVLDLASKPIHATGTVAAGELDAVGQLLRDLGDRPLIAGTTVASEHLNTVLHAVESGGRTVAAIVVGVDQQFAQRQFEEMVFDVLTVLMVSLFIAFELILAVLGRSITTPLRHLVTLLERGGRGRLGTRLEFRSGDAVGRVIARYNAIVDALNQHYAALAAKAAGAGGQTAALIAGMGRREGLRHEGQARPRPTTSPLDVRLPLFVFVFSEELQKPFLPLYIRSLATDATWLTPEILIGLPISVYMLVLAVATPFAGGLADRIGIKRIFMLGLIPAIIGFIGSALAQDVIMLLVARATTALGYAAVTIAAQGYIAGVAAPGERATGMSGYVGTIMAASICGMAVGGIVAGELGYRIVFMLAALLAVAAGLSGWRMLARLPSRREVGITQPAAKPGLNGLGLVLSNRRFLALVLFVAIPGKVALTGFLFFSIPLYLAELGAAEAEIGRVMIVYALLVVFLGPVASRLADRGGHTMLFSFIGTLLSGAAIAVLSTWSGMAAVMVAVALFGVAHAVSISPQLALATEVCRREAEMIGQTTILGLLRMLERAGSVAGPLLVAALVASYGFEGAMLFTGIGIALAALAFVAAGSSGRSDKARARRAAEARPAAA